MQNMKTNSSIVRHKRIFFNNLFFDSSQVDIDSQQDFRYKSNTSSNKNKSIERSINLSLEKSTLSRDTKQHPVLPRF